MKRTLCLLLASLTLLLSFSACGSGSADAPAVQTTAQPASETTEAEIVTEPEYVIVPEDFGGIDFTIFGVEPHNKDWMVNTYSEALAETENGDPINDALYRRTVEIEEAYKIHLIAVGTERGSVGGDALKVIMAGDDTYQVVNLQGASASKVLGSYGSLYDLFEIDTIDLTHSWWDANSVESFAIAGKLFNVVGDLNIRSFFSSTGLMMSRQLVTDYDLDDPYVLIRRGEWTVDQLIKMCEDVTQDVNGDGVIGLEDTAGIFAEAVSLLWGINAFGDRIVSNVNGRPEITINNERVVTAVEKYVKLFRDGRASIWATDISKQFAGENIWRTRMLPMLMENKLLFYSSDIGLTLELRSMESDFGILPMPKYNESQDTYYSSTHPAYLSFMTIPATNPEPERTGTIMESMNYLSKEYVMTAIYETTLVNKVIRDEESGEMLDLIRANRIFDFGYIFNWGGASSFITDFAANNHTDFASSYAKVESKIQSAIDDYMAAYAK